MTFKVWSNGCPCGSVSPQGLEPRTWVPNPEPSLCVYLFIYSHWGHKSLGPSSQHSDICACYTVMTECGRGDLKQSCRARSDISPKCCAGVFFLTLYLFFSLNPEGQKLLVRQVWLIITMFRVCFFVVVVLCGDLSQIFNFSSVVKAAVRKSNSRICKIQNDVLFSFDLPQRTFKKTTTLPQSSLLRLSFCSLSAKWRATCWSPWTSLTTCRWRTWGSSAGPSCTRTATRWQSSSITGGTETLACVSSAWRTSQVSGGNWCWIRTYNHI